MKTTLRLFLSVSVFAFCMLLLAPAGVRDATAANSALGLLRCDVAGGTSFVFGSTRSLSCTYEPDGAPVETYSGSIKKFGVDIGFLRRGVMIWAVSAPFTPDSPGVLSGRYVGVSADVAAGPGIGANALVGTNKVILNPLSISGAEGVNLAVGVSSIELF